MTRGGSRVGAGRKKGVPNRRSAELLERASGEGEMPLDHMLRIMRDPKVDPKRRDEMAKLAAPYCHARLATKASVTPDNWTAHDSELAKWLES